MEDPLDRPPIAAREAKQTRLLEQPGVAFEHLYQADLWEESEGSTTAARSILRGRNDAAHKLGVPLPAGHVVVYQDTPRGRMLAGETDLRDTAEGEDVELKLAPAPDIRVRQPRVAHDAAPPVVTPLAGPINVARFTGQTEETVSVSNASARAVAFELRLRTPPGAQATSDGQPAALKDGRPIFRLTVPAGEERVVTYWVVK